MFVSIHIPKTAGTLLGDIFDHGSGRKVLWDYAGDYSNADSIDPSWVAHANFIEKAFWGIHGHFYYRKYSNIFPSATFITCLRHPITRLESQFRHELFDAINGSGDWRANDLASGKMSFVDFVQSDNNTKLAQVVHLAGREIEEYDFVFVTEFIDACVAAFVEKFQFRRNDPYFGAKMPSLNRSDSRPFRFPERKERYDALSAITEDQRRLIFSLIPEEVDIYRRGVEISTRTLKNQ